MNRFIDIHTHKKTREDSVLAVQNIMAGEINSGLSGAGIFYSLGYHPWEIKPGKKASEMFASIEDSLSLANVVLIGETGLDRSIDAPIELQMELFKLHVEASEILHKPLLIHCVRAYSDLLELKKTIKPKIPWIIHGYQSNLQVLEKLVNMDFYISYGAGLLKDDQKFRNLLLFMPKSQLLFETDDSGIEIEVIYSQAATLLGADMEELKLSVYNNLKSLLPK